jgi:hypothetical protein
MGANQFAGKIDRSAEALWVRHHPLSFPSNRNPAYKTPGQPGKQNGEKAGGNIK